MPPPVGPRGSLPLRGLAYIGHHAPLAYALSIVLGLALPQLASTLRPAIPISIFLFIVLAFARANLPALKVLAGRPVYVGRALLLSTLVAPAIAGLVLISPPGQMLEGGVRLGIALMAAAPPLMASSAFMLVLGLENSLALTLLVLGMLVAPVASPAFASLLAGAAVPISPLMLAEKLALFIGLGMVLGLLLRRLVGYARITALKPELDGTGVLLYFVFAIAAMDGVIDTTLRQPLFVLGILALTSGIASLGFALTWGLARSFGFNDRFSLATSVAFRNMGLLMTPIFSLVPPTTFLYFALAQIPVYVGPMVLKAVKARLEPAPASDNA